MSLARATVAGLLLSVAACAGVAVPSSTEVLGVRFVDTELIAASGRRVPVRVAWRPSRRIAHLLAFSHGANSDAKRYDRLTGALAARGFVVVAPTHADSPFHPAGGKVDQTLSWALRIEDMKLALASDKPIEAATAMRIDPGLAGAVGHSYGALVAEALGGARVARPGEAADARVAAVAAFSPPGEIPGFVDRAGYAGLRVPLLVITGTADVLPMLAPQWQMHLASYEAASGPKTLLVGKDVDHYFGNIIGRPELPAASETVTQAFDAAIEAAADLFDGELALGSNAVRGLRPAFHKKHRSLFERIETER